MTKGLKSKNKHLRPRYGPIFQIGINSFRGPLPKKSQHPNYKNSDGTTWPNTAKAKMQKAQVCQVRGSYSACTLNVQHWRLVCTTYILVCPTYPPTMNFFLNSSLNPLRLGSKLRSDFPKVVNHIKLPTLCVCMAKRDSRAQKSLIHAWNQKHHKVCTFMPKEPMI